MTPRTHNVLSYAVALVVLPAVVVARGRAHGMNFGASALALPVVLWVLHFARRALEASFLHRYSKPRFPFGDALVEYVYYWGFGAWIGWALTASPPATLAARPWLGSALFVTGELGNHYCHRLLAALRRPGEMERPIPHGFLFEWVSCPHYLFEITSWVGFALVAPCLPSFCFLALGTAILSVWGSQRHRDYRRRFAGPNVPAYPPQRRALIPFVF